MSYKPNPRKTYKPRKALRHAAITPIHHLSFRSQWESNIDSAITQAYKLKDQGYLVEEGIEKGALMESQAKRIIKRLTEMGYEAQTIPVATWSGENVVFVVYKPPKEPEAPHPPPSQPKATKTRKDEDPKKLIERYIKNFFTPGSSPPDMQEFAQKGYLIDPGRVVALITPTAPSKDSLVQMLRDQQAQGQPLTTFENTQQFRTTTTKNKHLGAQYVIFDQKGEIGVRIQYFKEAIRSLGSGKISVYAPSKDKPVYLVREDDYAIAIAPGLDIDTARAVTVDSLVMQSKQT